MPNLHGVTDGELVAELERRGQQQAGVAGAIPGIPPFVMALLKKYLVGAAAPALVGEVVRAVLREKVDKGGGKTLPVGHEEVLTELEARGGEWTAVARLKGPAA